MELAIPIDGGRTDFAKVAKRLRDKDGLIIVRAHNNPILDTIMYKVEYKDVHKTSLASNVIADKNVAQVDVEGNHHVIFQKIFNHRYDGTEVKEKDLFIATYTGTKHRRETTNGFDILVQWKDGSTTWVTYKDMKISFSVHVDKYSVHCNIAGDPVFAW